jgi:alpha-L-fucosidase
MTLNNTWGFKRDDNKWKPAQTVVRNLVDIVSKGGNYLLNVGPTADGEIPAESVKRLADVGRWMKASGESIHGATAGPFKKLFWGRATTGKDGTLYLHAFVWPNGSDLIIPMQNRTTSFRPLFPVQAAPGLSRELDGLHITGLPATPPDPFVPVIAVGIDGRVHELSDTIRQRDDGTLILLAQDCDVHATSAKLEKKGDRPYNIGYWTNVKDTISWYARIDKLGPYTVDLEYSLGGPPPGSEISIDFGKDQSILVKLPPGKDFLDFRTINVGTIDLLPVELTITVRPTKKTGVAVMDLRQIRLTPAKQ